MSNNENYTAVANSNRKLKWSVLSQCVVIQCQHHVMRVLTQGNTLDPEQIVWHMYTVFAKICPCMHNEIHMYILRTSEYKHVSGISRATLYTRNWCVQSVTLKFQIERYVFSVYVNFTRSCWIVENARCAACSCGRSSCGRHPNCLCLNNIADILLLLVRSALVAPNRVWSMAPSFPISTVHQRPPHTAEWQQSPQGMVGIVANESRNTAQTCYSRL